MGESEGVSSPGQIAGTIPLFFYDLIGRIVPGAVGGWPTSPACKFTPTYLWNADREITGGAPLLALFEKGHAGQPTHRALCDVWVSRVALCRKAWALR